MSNLVNIMQDLFDRINLLEIEVISVALPRVFVCETKYISIGKTIKDENNNEYLVTAFEANNWIDVSAKNGAPPFAGTIVKPPPVLFMHGTPKTTNNEFLQINSRTLKKVPFAWLLESYEYDDLAPDSSLEAVFNVRIFLLDWCDLPKWTNNKHNELAIKPMEALRDSLREVINSDYSFKRLVSINTKVRPRFGVEISNEGNDRQIIDQDLSGIEIVFSLEAYDVSVCKC